MSGISNMETDMTQPNYQRSITVEANPEDVLKALTIGYSKWWTTPDKPLEKVGDRAKFMFGGKSYWTFEAIELSKQNN